MYSRRQVLRQSLQHNALTYSCGGKTLARTIAIYSRTRVSFIGPALLAGLLAFGAAGAAGRDPRAAFDAVAGTSRTGALYLASCGRNYVDTRALLTLFTSGKSSNPSGCFDPARRRGKSVKTPTPRRQRPFR